MATKKQIEANRRNAQSSTGPQTPAGKARSSTNALTHGLTAARALLPSEDEAEFDHLLRSFQDELAPAGSLETELVDYLTMAAWRLRRFRVFESRYFHQRLADLKDSLSERRYNHPSDGIGFIYSWDCTNEKGFDNLSRHEVRIERAFYRALKEIQRLQAARAGSPPPAPASPLPPRQMKICKTNPLRPAADRARAKTSR